MGHTQKEKILVEMRLIKIQKCGSTPPSKPLPSNLRITQPAVTRTLPARAVRQQVVPLRDLYSNGWVSATLGICLDVTLRSATGSLKIINLKSSIENNIILKCSSTRKVERNVTSRQIPSVAENRLCRDPRGGPPAGRVLVTAG